jgi:hypothetical protein
MPVIQYVLQTSWKCEHFTSSLQLPFISFFASLKRKNVSLQLTGTEKI